jgi:hypothetical protein
MARTIGCVSFVLMLGIAGLGARSMDHGFVTGAVSKAELVAHLLDALERNDADTLRRLRLTESEYKGIILPGHYPSEVSDFAWQTLNTKSLYYERYLLTEFGGRHYELQDVRFERGTADHAGYSAHKQLRLSLTHEGSPVELATGSIVEVRGRYKFASFIRD